MSACPWKAMLPSVGADALGDATYAALERHVEECPDCRSGLEGLAHRWVERTLVLPGPGRSPRIPGFEIRGELGRGGMGVVYLAVRTGLDRPVALKVVPGACLHEARAASRIRHPGVVPLYDFGEADSWHYLVLEYIPGGSLKARLTEPLPPPSAARLVEQIARAVAHIHGRGLLHLDLKPSNILLDGEIDAPWDRVIPRVSDFGLARFDDPDASTASLAGLRGTPCYMAPEQTGIPDVKIGTAADIYALGAILYELLTRRPPLQGASTFETIEQVRGRCPVPPRTLDPAIPRDLEVICLKCLEKEPGRRYASAGAMADDLGRSLDGRPISARPVSLFEKARRWCRRRPAIASLIAALAVSLVGGFALLFALWRLAEAGRSRVEAEHVRVEAARRLAEDNEKLASRALGEFTDVLYSALEHPEKLSEGRIFELIYLLKEQTGRWRNSRGAGPWSVPGVGVLERVLAVKLFERGRRKEGRSLLDDSIAYLRECQRLDPDDENTLWQLGQSLLHAGDQAAADSAFDEALAFFEQASTLCGALRTLSFRLELPCALYSARREIAAQLSDRGETEKARCVMDAARRSFLSMEVPGADRKERVPPKEHAPGDVETARRRVERLRAAVRDSPEDRWLRRDVEMYMTNLILAVAPSSPGATLPEESGDRFDSEAWAGSVLSLIRSRGAALGLDEPAVPILALNLLDPVSNRASGQRRLGRLEGAEATVAWLLAFARRLVREYPDRPESHMVLGEAHIQVSKNAWKREDYPAIERALRLALESARHARDLDPRHEGARLLVENIVARLAMFDAPLARPKMK
jgi:serine/threonine protein kinase